MPAINDLTRQSLYNDIEELKQFIIALLLSQKDGTLRVSIKKYHLAKGAEFEVVEDRDNRCYILKLFEPENAIPIKHNYKYEIQSLLDEEADQEARLQKERAKLDSVMTQLSQELNKTDFPL